MTCAAGLVVLVTGGRDYDDRGAIFRTLSEIHARTPIGLIISGACVDRNTGEMCGADGIAIHWALQNEVDFNGRPDRWMLDGYPQAGPMRNSRQLAEHRPILDLAVEAPGGSGTGDMRKKLLSAGIKIVEVSA